MTEKKDELPKKDKERDKFLEDVLRYGTGPKYMRCSEETYKKIKAWAEEKE